MVKELIETFRKPSAEQLAQRELEEAKRELLKAQTHQEFYKRVADYNEDRVRRLSNYLGRARGTAA